MHPILADQLQRYVPQPELLPPEFLAAISASYERAESDFATLKDFLDVASAAYERAKSDCFRVRNLAEGRSQTARAALADTQALLLTVVAHAPVMICGLDCAGVFTLSEGQALDKLGFVPGQLVGQSIYSVYAHAPEVIGNFKRALEGRVSAFIAHLHGRVFASLFAPLLDDDGAIIGVVGVANDTTDGWHSQEKPPDIGTERHAGATDNAGSGAFTPSQSINR